MPNKYSVKVEFLETIVLILSIKKIMNVMGKLISL